MISHSKPTICTNDLNSIENCVNSGIISRNSITNNFENNLKLFLDSSYVKATGSGTSALVLALWALGIKDKSQEILLPTYVCKNVLEAILHCGGTPVFYDNAENSWVSHLNQIKEKLSKNTAAIIVVHSLGLSVSTIEEIVELGIPVIEDVCQSIGVDLNDKKLGCFGSIGVYSFNATKYLTTGEGGAVATNNPEIAKRLNLIYESIAGIFTFNDIQAALGISQLNNYAFFLNQRMKIANSYFQLLPEKYTSTFSRVFRSGNLFRFLLEVDAPFEKVKFDFHKEGISIRKGVDELLHRNYNLNSDYSFPNAVNMFDRTISIPIYPSLTEDETFKIITITNNILEDNEN